MLFFDCCNHSFSVSFIRDGCLATSIKCIVVKSYFSKTFVDGKITPLFLVDGFPQSGCSTLSRLIANTYSLDFIDGNEIIRKLFEQSKYASPTNPMEKEKSFADFLEKEVATNPAVLNQLFGYLEEKMKTAQKPLLLNMTGIVGYCIAKKIVPLYQLFVQCEGNERAQRIYRAAKASPSLGELNDMVAALLRQDAIYSAMLHNQFDMNVLHDEPEYKVNFMNSSNIPAEQLFQQITSGEPFTTAYKQAEKFLPEIAQEWTRWKCLVCGFVYEGQEHLTVCPRCKNADPDKFGDPE